MGGPSAPDAQSETVGESVYVDLGGDDEPTNITGFAVSADVADLGEDWTCTLGGQSDTTKRDQLATSSTNGWAAVPIASTPGESMKLSFCIEANESGSDDWQLWLGGDRPEDYGCHELILAKPQDLTPGMNVLTVEIPAECIPSDRVLLVFSNQPEEGAGIWGFLVEQGAPAQAENGGDSSSDPGEVNAPADEPTADDAANSAEELATDTATEEQAAQEEATDQAEVAEVEVAEERSDLDDVLATEESEEVSEAAIQPIEAVAIDQTVGEPQTADTATSNEEGDASESAGIVPLEDAAVETSSEESEPDQQTTEAAAEQPLEVATDQPTESPTEAPTEIPTEVPTEIPTEVPTEAPTEEPTAEPTVELPVDPMTPGATYLDIGGNPEPSDIYGLSSNQIDYAESGDPLSCKLGGYRDYSARSQNGQNGAPAEATVRVPINRLQQTTISFCIESNEFGSDNWEVRLGTDSFGNQTCDYVQLTRPSHFGPGLNVATLVIPPECLPEDSVELVFINRGDEGAAIWGLLIEQDPMITSEPPTPEGTPD